ncbi:ABC transporter substrate-binding protein [Variovorax saccharolyticus]|uniref:ABC transporter substrate-binding protein n=1 Tax=Variovorax saccharolyticus TaxID=3053516 RepID=UPI002575C51E|nr:ABC transporter substrate-binding protein [Variovorax sp. J22R187]MDM0021832.1 ABC transporter substrate-binding protein [Variovorax sp. J22R187]
MNYPTNFARQTEGSIVGGNAIRSASRGMASSLRKAAMTIAVGVGLAISSLNAVNAQTLKVGVIAPLTGGGAPWGMAMAEGTKIAAEEVNAQGGLDVGGKKYQVQVIVYDDQFKAADSVAAYNRLVNNDKVQYMAIFHSPAALALKNSLESDKVVAITAAAAKDAIDANTKFLFRMNSVPENYEAALVTWLKDRYKQRRIVLINPNDAVGWVMSQSSDPLYKKAGFEVLDNLMYERAQSDFQSLLTKVVALKPEMIDIGATPPATAGLMVRQARELGYKGLILKTGGPGWSEIVATAGKDASEGLISALYADPKNEGYRQLSAKYKKTVGQAPNEMILPTYDAMKVMFRAIEKTGDVNNTSGVAAAFAKVLPVKSLQGDEMTIGGKDLFGSNQQIITWTYIGEIKNGEAVAVGKVK